MHQRMTHPCRRHDLVISAHARGCVVKDPASGRFFRLGEREAFVLGQLDGATPVETVAARMHHRSGGTPPAAIAQFIEQLREHGLLAGHGGPAPRRARVHGDLLVLRIRLWDPDRALDRLARRLRWCFTRPFVTVAGALIAGALAVTLLHVPRIGSDLARLAQLRQLPLFWLAAGLAITAHELAHAVTCKRFGGEVRELGFMLLIFHPALYCNVSDAWLFPEKTKRLWVSFAGAFVEIALWALATLTWWVVPAGPVRDVAVVVMATSGAKTLLNFNPLIRLDGYYLLCDLLDLPNLRPRSFRYLRALVAHRFRRTAAMDHVTPREHWIYLTYGLLAGAFVAWLIGTTLAALGGTLIGRYQIAGAVVFLLLLVGVFRVPLRDAVRWIIRRRRRQTLNGATGPPA